MDKKIIISEILRINEMMGNKKILLEQPIPRLVRFLQHSFDDAASVGTQIGDDVSVRGVRMAKNTYDDIRRKLNTSNPFASLTNDEYQMVIRILNKSKDFSQEVLDDFIKQMELLDNTLDSEMKILRRLYGAIGEIGVEDASIVRNEINRMTGEPIITDILFDNLWGKLRKMPEIEKAAARTQGRIQAGSETGSQKWSSLFQFHYNRFFPRFWRSWFLQRDEIIQGIERTLDKIASDLLKETPENIQDELRYLFDQIVTLRKSYKEDLTKYFKKYLTENQITNFDKKYLDEFFEDPVYKEIIDETSKDFFTSGWKNAVLSFFALFKNVNEFTNQMNPITKMVYSNFIRTKWNVIWNDARTQRELMKTYARVGPNRAIATKVMSYVFFTNILWPIIAAAVSQFASAVRVQQLNKEMAKIKAELCDKNPPILTDSECATLKPLPPGTMEGFKETIYEYSDLFSLFTGKFGLDNVLFMTQVDEVIRFTANVWSQQVLTPEGLTEDWFLNEVLNKCKAKEEWEKLGFNANKSFEENLEIMASKGKNRQSLEQGNTVKVGDIEVGGKDSFKSFCELSDGKYTYVDYTEGHIGIAKDVNNKNIEFEWNPDTNQWEESK